MITNPWCPVCDHSSWTTIGQSVFRRDVGSNQGSEYVRKRLRVLFELWVPDSEKFSVDWQMCTFCGLVIYTPRPSEEDLRNKYQMLVSLGSDDEKDLDNPVLDKRAKQLFRQATRYFSEKSKRVLDYGGGNGRMLKPFVNAGWQCSIIDYVHCIVDGVEKLADTVDGLPESAQFDLIVCSHVLEHLAKPRPILERLAQHLAPKGQLYLEVPLELWRRAPNPQEPVTHVNYFTPGSLCFLARQAGLRARCRLGWAYHTASGNIMVIRAWCRRIAANEKGQGLRSPPDTLKFLNPGLGLRLRMFLSRPDWLKRAVTRFTRSKRG